MILGRDAQPIISHTQYGKARLVFNRNGNLPMIMMLDRVGDKVSQHSIKWRLSHPDHRCARHLNGEAVRELKHFGDFGDRLRNGHGSHRLLISHFVQPRIIQKLGQHP